MQICTLPQSIEDTKFNFGEHKNKAVRPITPVPPCTSLMHFCFKNTQKCHSNQWGEKPLPIRDVHPSDTPLPGTTLLITPNASLIGSHTIMPQTAH